MTIFLCDLTHTGSKIATENIPLGIGYLATFLHKALGDSVNVELFKYPSALLDRLKSNEVKPDVVGFANYSWNDNLNEHFCEIVKQLYPECITVKGAANFPLYKDDQANYLRTHKFTDVYIPYEGENAFVIFLTTLKERGKEWKHAPIAGSCFIDNNGIYQQGGAIERIKPLTEAVPSPYLAGYLDQFFDGDLTPIIQRTRGCPFTCNYCNEGYEYYTKVNKFDIERTKQELHYIGQRVKGLGIKNLIITDMNFGMYEEDLEIANEIKQCQELYGWPLAIVVSTGKNKIENIAEVARKLGNSIIISMSMQSMSEEVLETIKRKNIKPKMYIELVDKLSDQSKLAELILPLPNETFESYLEANRFLMNAKVDKIVNYTLQMNLGTDYKNEAYLKEYGYKTAFRLYANCFGRYDGKTIIECEEVGISTNTISFDEYLKIRRFAFLVELIYNNNIFGEYYKLLLNYDVPAYDFFVFCFEQMELLKSNNPLKQAFEDFSTETANELYDNEESAKALFAREENYKRLLNGELGRNVIFANKAVIYIQLSTNLSEFIAATFSLFIQKNKIPMVSEEVENLLNYSKNKISGLFDKNAPIEQTANFSYDVLAWLDNSSQPLSSFKTDKTYRFYFDTHQQDERKDLFSRYGNDVIGAMKILARVPNLDKLMRKIETVGV